MGAITKPFSFSGNSQGRTKQGVKVPWNKFWNEITVILVTFTEDTVNCEVDVLHSDYGNAKRNTNTEDS